MKFFLKGMLWTLVAVVLVGISPSWADIGWQKLNGPHGPDIVAVDVDHTELREIYAGLDGGGVYKSPDGGYEWFRVGEDIPEMWACADLVTDPNDIGAIYVGCWWEGLFRSQDAGDTWQRISNPSNFRTAWSIALDPVVPNRIVVGTRSYIWISTDNGISWEQKTAGLTNPKIFCVVIDPSDPTILYAGNTFGSQPRLYKSTDAGETWSFSDSGLTANANIADIAVNPSDNNIVFAATDAGIYRSTDGGSTWVVSAGVDSISFPRDIEFDAHDHNVIHVASWGGIYTSTDGGISWQRSSPLNETPFYKGLAVDPNVNGALYGGGFGGVLKSTDHGSTWEPMSNDGFALDVQIADDNLWVDPRNSQRLFAGTFGGGVFKSDDGGQSWVGINSGLSCAWTNGGGCCGYLNNSLVLYIGTDGGGLYRSYDVGQSWQAVNNGVNKLTVQEMEMDPTDPLTLYLIADSLYKSYDGGDSWSVPTTNPACVRFRGIAVDSVNPQIVYASASPGVYKSYDGGETWLDISGPLAASKCGEVELDPYDSDIVYITTRYDGLFKSTDGGTNWIDLNEGLPEYEGEIRVECDVAINPKNTDEVYVGLFHNGVFKSVDGGEHWNNWSHGLGNLRINALTLDPQNLSTVYVGTGAGAFRRVPPPTMVIEKTHGTLQGHYQDVSITLEDYELEMGGFDFLIAYDASALGFMEAEPGQLLEDCGWEYFTYRYGADGNCGDACPSGMVRVVGLAETNNGANYPSCYGPPDVDPHELARIKFLVSNDRTLECQYVPIRFFWANCGDNTISDVTGDTLFVSNHVYDLEGTEITAPTFGFPTYFGVQQECLENGDPDKPIAMQFIDYVNGGIDIICADSIDLRDDINLNGIRDEISDAVMFVKYFVVGLVAFGNHPAGSIAASDCNADGITLSVADLVYLLRVITGSAPPIPKLAPIQANVDLTDGVLSIDTEIGAAFVQIDGHVTPILLAENMEMKYGHDADNDVTRILIYSLKEGQWFQGRFLDGIGNCSVRLEMATYDGTPVEAKLLPTQFALHQNYPNPFNPATTISFDVPTECEYELVILNVLGQAVTSFEGHAEPGVVEVRWDATSYASGVYLYRLTAGSFTVTKKMVLLK